MTFPLSLHFLEMAMLAGLFGFTEIVFARFDLLGLQFAPRISNDLLKMSRAILCSCIAKCVLVAMMGVARW
jgi:TnpA family transposase